MVLLKFSRRRCTQREDSVSLLPRRAPLHLPVHHFLIYNGKRGGACRDKQSWRRSKASASPTWAQLSCFSLLDDLDETSQERNTRKTAKKKSNTTGDVLSHTININLNRARQKGCEDLLWLRSPQHFFSKPLIPREAGKLCFFEGSILPTSVICPSNWGWLVPEIPRCCSKFMCPKQSHLLHPLLLSTRPQPPHGATLTLPAWLVREKFKS